MNASLSLQRGAANGRPRALFPPTGASHTDNGARVPYGRNSEQATTGRPPLRDRGDTGQGVDDGDCALPANH